MQLDEAQLKKFVVEGGIVSAADYEQIAEQAKTNNQKIADLLLSSGKISEADLKKTEAFALGIPYVDLLGKKIDFATLSLIPEPIARNYNIVAYKKGEESLEVAML